MSERPEILAEVRRWLAKAEHDLRNAEHVLTMEEDCPFDTICFHAQQCAEKYLKAWLVLKSIDPQKTHDVVILLRQAAAAGLAGIEPGDVHQLNRYTVEARYPGDWDPIERAEAVDAIGRARMVRERVRGSMPREVLKERK